MLKKITPRLWIIAVVILAALAVAVLTYRVAASGTYLVSHDTAPAENQPGWMFNRGLSLATPYSFVAGVGSTGLGSLYVGPGANANDKFVAEFFPTTTTVADFTSFSYDLKMGATAQEESKNQFMVSVYANTDSSTNAYDCRFDYKPTSASNSSFLKTYVYPSTSPSLVSKGSDRIENCPATLDGMPAGSHIRVFALSMGDTGEDDSGLEAYFDNVEVVIGTDGTTYNFEPAPQTQADCADKKWQQYKFRNQGQCLKYVDKGIDTR